MVVGKVVDNSLQFTKKKKKMMQPFACCVFRCIKFVMLNRLKKLETNPRIIYQIQSWLTKAFEFY